MPPRGRTAYHPAFPPAVRLGVVGCIRVAHPSATLAAPEGTAPVRLACIRPAASVHPEPGSNSSLYYCLFFFFSVSWAPLCFLYTFSGSLYPAASPSRATAAGLCWPQALKDRSAKPPSSQYRSPSFCGCKSTTFSLTDNDFFYLFFIPLSIILVIRLKNFIVNKNFNLIIHLLIYKTFFSLMNHQITSPKQSK